MMDNNLSDPKVLLITDGPLSEEGYGIRRTLLNIFEKFPLHVFAPYSSDDSSYNFINEHSFFKASIFPKITNRMGAYLSPITKFIDLTYLSNRNIEIQSKTVCNIGVVSSNLISTHIAASNLFKSLNLPYVVYLMDEVEELETSKWLTGDGKNLIKTLLANSSGWMSVSEELITSTSKRLSVSPSKTLIVHNPVKISNYNEPLSKDIFTIGYAGSIWDMQKDPLVATAKAIKVIKGKGHPIELVLHTSEYFWNKDADSLWLPLNVRYGGELPYNSLHKTLSEECDLLLVTASFLDKFNSYSLSSLQTKLTDYMATGRAIFCVAPEGSAVGKFVKKWGCGFVNENNDVSSIADELLRISGSKENLILAGKQGYEAAKSHFSVETIRENVRSFLMNCL